MLLSSHDVAWCYLPTDESHRDHVGEVANGGRVVARILAGCSCSSASWSSSGHCTLLRVKVEDVDAAETSTVPFQQQESRESAFFLFSLGRQ